jgi:PPOX class probable FMN-dependent enzyme
VSGGAGDGHAVASVAELRALVGDPLPRTLAKEVPTLDERSVAFIRASPFLVLATAAADGSCDASPKGGPAGFVQVVDERRLLVPEFPGNRRFDGVHNLVERPGVGLIFLVPGITETLRVNGFAGLSRDPELLRRCAVDGKEPWLVLDVEVRQVFSHCSKAFLRSGLWRPEAWPDASTVVSPSRTIADRAVAERRSEADVRREVDDGYRPSLY